MVTKGSLQQAGQDQQQGSQCVVAGAGDHFKKGNTGGGGNGKAFAEQFPRSINNQRAPYADPTGSSSLLLLESKIRRATPQAPESQEAFSKRPVALQRWLSQNQDFPEYWHSFGGSEGRGDTSRSVEGREKEDEERRTRHKEMSQYPQGDDF